MLMLHAAICILFAAITLIARYYVDAAMPIFNMLIFDADATLSLFHAAYYAMMLDDATRVTPPYDATLPPCCHTLAAA